MGNYTVDRSTLVRPKDEALQSKDFIQK
ncbi:uncharacterized protein G2W53_000928 [Senna tora]|uniref:Uncharacterized protein n=1 Tax=Senna tora TaxID=362788 RepID=A0A834XGA3_9FABA|nr:uncharacterized protein G2W53_000928 [Senna tora]